MSVDERTRHEIHGRFEELLGPELASAFMSYLPPVGWADVATKRDLDALEHRLEAAMFRQSAELRIEMGREVGSLRSEVGGEIGGLRSELTDRMDRQFRATIFALIGSNMTLAGLAFAAARLG